MPSLTLLTEQLLAPVPGGTGRYTREVAAAVSTSVPHDWRVRSVVAWHRDTSPAKIPGLGSPRRLPTGPRVLARLWQRELPPWPGGSVVHAMTPLAPVRARPRRGALVVTIHDVVPYTHPETLTPRGVNWHRLMIGLAGEHADAIVVPTQAVADGLAVHVGIAERVHVIGEGVTAACAAPARGHRVREVRERLGLPVEYLVTVGTLEPRKGLDVLLDALAELGSKAGSLALVVIGPDGWGDLRVAEEAARRGLGDRVHVVGRLADREMAAVVSGALASVTASRAEGFGLPLIEAMSMGVPTIYPAIPVLVEVAGGHGRPFAVGEAADLAEAIGWVLGHQGQAQEEAAAARGFVSRYTWQHVAAQLWALYTTLV